MQIYSLVGDDIHLNWVIGVETFSTKKILLAIKNWSGHLFSRSPLDALRKYHSYSQMLFDLESS